MRVRSWRRSDGLPPRRTRSFSRCCGSRCCSARTPCSLSARPPTAVATTGTTSRSTIPSRRGGRTSSASSATTRGRGHRIPRGRRRHPPSRRRRRPALRRRAPLVGGRLEVQVPVDVRLQHLGEALHVLLVLGRAALDVAVGEDPRLVDLVVALLVG